MPTLLAKANVLEVLDFAEMKKKQATLGGFVGRNSTSEAAGPSTSAMADRARVSPPPASNAALAAVPSSQEAENERGR